MRISSATHLRHVLPPSLSIQRKELLENALVLHPARGSHLCLVICQHCDNAVTFDLIIPRSTSRAFPILFGAHIILVDIAR